jgi:hypothetical protein
LFGYSEFVHKKRALIGVSWRYLPLEWGNLGFSIFDFRFWIAEKENEGPEAEAKRWGQKDKRTKQDGRRARTLNIAD